MKQLTLITIVTAMVAIISGPAHAGDGAHGYMRVCISDNNCVSLKDAGLQIKDPDDFYILPGEIISAINSSITTALGKNSTSKSLIKQTFGSPKTFVVVDTIDAKKVKKLTDEYKAIVHKLYPKYDLSKVDFPAYSDDEHTFLLRDKFFAPNMTPQEQAKILVHEGNVRSPESNRLAIALEFDDAFADILSGKSPELRHQQVSALFRALLRLNVVQTESAVIEAVSSIAEERGSVVKVSEICEAKKNYPIKYDAGAREYRRDYSARLLSDCVADYAMVLNFASLDRNAALLLNELHIQWYDDEIGMNTQDWEVKKFAKYCASVTPEANDAWQYLLINQGLLDDNDGPVIVACIRDPQNPQIRKFGGVTRIKFYKGKKEPGNEDLYFVSDEWIKN
jgi:hypothetical protein